MPERLTSTKVECLGLPKQSKTANLGLSLTLGKLVLFCFVLHLGILYRSMAYSWNTNYIWNDEIYDVKIIYEKIWRYIPTICH